LQIKPGPVANATASAAEAKLYIESPKPIMAVVEPSNDVRTEAVTSEVTFGSKQTAIAPPDVVAKALPVKPTETKVGKKTLLQSLRDQHLTNKKSEHIKEAVPVTKENLEEHWKCFTEKLKQQLKHSVVTVFNNARLAVVNEQHFSITVSASLEQKFIEQEKLLLLEYLKGCFQNRNIGFTIHIDEQPKEIVISEATLTSREKYQKVIEQYPMIKELKDRLRLELDY
jgi:DNA polymerase-3 subunit gamma/tau